MGDFSQEEIDKLLAGGIDDAAEEAAPAQEPDPDLAGIASQDDIDALFAAVGSDPAPAGENAASQPAAEEKPSAETAPDGADGDDSGGIASQGDIDALFAAVGGNLDSGREEEKPAAEASADTETVDAVDDGGIADQSDIDALFAAVGGTPEPDAAATPDSETRHELHSPETTEISPPDIAGPETEAAAELDDSASIHELLSSLTTESPAKRQPGDASETVSVDTDEMNKILDSLGQMPPSSFAADGGVDSGATVVLNRDLYDTDPHSAMPPQTPSVPPHSDSSTGVTRIVAEKPVPVLPPQPAPPAGAAQLRDSISIMSSAGEVESMASQISGMLGQLSEKAHRYMQAWITADGEAKELRARLLHEEHLRAVAAGERDALGKELEYLRTKVGAIEGEKIGVEEARRTTEAALHSQIRELESRVKIQTSEIDSLKDELTRARTEATGVDIESRRARFEADRLKSEIESERMERLRIQRALENREKELQAMQAQSAGQASSLFIDELHRLVRRLEAELDARSSGAHEALKQVDRLEVPESMVPVLSNLRAALMQAIGADDSADDALKTLGREAERVRGPQALAPDKTDMVSFETALSTYNLGSALEVAGTLLREAKATPAALMRRIYQCSSLRRPEVGEHLGDLARLLEGLRTVQESADRTRGAESGESEVFYVQMFDFLHNLVRLKLITRLTGEIWRIFLDLRGRFSFVTSDKQWADYRDGVLGDRQAKQ